MTTLLEEALKEFDKVELPEGFTIDKDDGRVLHDGYIFIRQRTTIKACIVDVEKQARAATPGGKGPLTIEKWDGEWVILCDADTPEQAVSAFINFATFGAFQ